MRVGIDFGGLIWPAVGRSPPRMGHCDVAVSERALCVWLFLFLKPRVRGVVVPIVQMEKQRLREAKRFVQGHTAHSRQSLASYPGLYYPTEHVFSTDASSSHILRHYYVPARVM